MVSTRILTPKWRKQLIAANVAQHYAAVGMPCALAAIVAEDNIAVKSSTRLFFTVYGSSGLRIPHALHTGHSQHVSSKLSFGWRHIITQDVPAALDDQEVLAELVHRDQRTEADDDHRRGICRETGHKPGNSNEEMHDKG